MPGMGIVSHSFFHLAKIRYAYIYCDITKAFLPTPFP